MSHLRTESLLHCTHIGKRFFLAGVEWEHNEVYVTVSVHHWWLVGTEPFHRGFIVSTYL